MEETGKKSMEQTRNLWKKLGNNWKDTAKRIGWNFLKKLGMFSFHV